MFPYFGGTVLTVKFKSRLWIKGILVVFLIVGLCSLSIALYCIPLTWQITYQMEKKFAISQLDRVLSMVAVKYAEIEQYRKFALQMKKQALKDIVSVVYGYVDTEYKTSFKAGSGEQRHIQDRVIRNVRKMRYGKDDYVFISDFDSVLICHPDDNLQGKDYSGIRDVYGNLIVPVLVATARTMEEGFTSYWWNRLGKTEPSEKMTYSRLFPPWAWVLATGVYIDDIEEEVNRRKKSLIEQLRTMMNRIVIGKTGYMYIFDSNMNMIIHPNPKLEGINFEHIKNPLTGKSLARELAKIAHQENNELVYVWDRPTDPGNYVYDKISWVAYFKGFDWYIGSSVYTDELSDDSRLLAKRMLLSSIIAFIASLILGGFFLKRLVRPIEHLSKVALQVQKGDLEVRSGIRRQDEIGILACEFDSMVKELKENVEKLDLKVQEKTRELNENYDKLEAANRQIIDSIQYAETIQNGILPKKENMALHMRDHFVIWKPKDIIGGDFFWFTPRDNGFLVAVADCTGHGVPGAIMTMIAGMALPQVVREMDATDPSAILKALNQLVQRVLNQHTRQSRSDDGLDIGICHVSRDNNTIRFSGARIDLYYTLGGELMFLKGDKQSVGYKSSDISYDYAIHEIHLESDMRFFMTTDGLLDQGGGPKGFPFGKRRFREFLVEHQGETLEEQKESLKRKVEEYRGGEDQRDDVTVVGFTV